MSSTQPATEVNTFSIVLPPVPVAPEKTAPQPELTGGRNSEGEAAGEGRGAPSTSLLPPKPKSVRYQSLDLWRGAACLMLVFYHSTFYGDYHFRLSDFSSWTWAGLPLYAIRHCWIGVPIFFVISGYCISASVDSLRRRPHSIHDYFVRRFRRIYPPLWIMCVLAVLFTLALSYWPAIYSHCLQLPRLADLTFSQWLGNFLAAESWRHNLTAGQPTYLMGNTWTLCYEEQFYFVAGVMLALGSRRFFSVAAWLTVAVIGTRHLLRMIGVSHEGFFWDGHWILFAIGILVYHVLNYWQRPRLWYSLPIFFAGMLYGIGERVLNQDPFQKHLGEYLFVASAFAIGLLLLRRWDNAISQFKWLAPLRWCGQRSYSIYLTHYLLVTLVSSLFAAAGLRSEFLVATVVVPTCLLITLPVAILFYSTVECRFINMPLDAKAEQGRGGQGRARLQLAEQTGI